jgi:threonine/homoserine/homoserine lactone efflux protein
MTLAEFAALVLFATAMSFTPGPNTLLSAALAANGGLRCALPFIVAVPAGWCLLLLASAGGLGTLVQAAPALRGTIKTLGLAYMLWLAWRLAGTARLAQAGAPLRVGFMQGVLLQFVNIKAWLSALMVSAGWITVAEPAGPRLAIALALWLACGLASNLTYALVGTSLRGWLSAGQRLAWFNRAMAAVLLATAVWMAAL